MAIIHELSPHLADLIAAGEVVERPASVAKELIENAIDAGSTRITVEIESGGITYLRIADNGCGMSAEDAPIAFRRHATSKLRTEEDLAAIGTLGFRGEALAAISSVTRIDLFTRQGGALAGLHLHLEAGEIQANEEAGCPEGTTIVVRDLFYNTPARMKFLKKDFTEAGYILGVVQHAALSHPEIAFTLIRDGKQVFSTDGKGKLLAPVFSVFGKEMTANMIEVPKTERNGMTVYGYIVKPHAGRPNRSMQHFFVNGRYVKSRLMQAALEEAYRNAIITGKYPSGAVFLELPLAAVDVNVHPAKTEVKFSQEKPVFEAVYIACKNAISANDNMPRLEHREKEAPARPREDHLTQEQQRFAVPAPSFSTAPVSKATAEEPPELEDFLVSVPPRAQKPRPYTGYAAAPRIWEGDPPKHTFRPYPVHEPAPAAESRPEAQEQQSTAPAPQEPRLEPLDTGARVIGECFQTYLIAEDKDGLILIDKHAAHERILFNKMRAETDMPQQELLAPVIVELTGEEAAAIQARLGDIRKAGFSIDPFGENSFAVRSVPAYLDSGDVQSVIGELAEKAMNSRATVPDQLDDLIHTVACKAAIKAGRATTQIELQDLCDRVLADENIRSCPHGRPTTVRLTKYELDKLFKRVNQ
ncbi:DNA mismatch repair endonuclease MutL [Agathobaculum sp. NSJ-28]|uniref:DNA mismatch repair protein MutL n=2 Tax=Agathobaculum TaxID=2048137 RepID=A0A923LTD8_9FIRM|nr:MULTISPECIES: DNA mismatch repair endonuclease MutL [Agathobaculum]MBC5724101.1 DNA mismatch repair endonuclease MutL [Agathobaculum faecis]MCU6787734.1 DNA mismatch repair endonuclease MutL [Agathobaculum ammoniilyticum]SCI44048.1 DNA mismatch repair protein mutL [uncultured Butyricicoccus sp.]